MTFNTIKLNFEDAKEQKFVEENAGLKICDKSAEDLWTEFDISSFEPEDIAYCFNRVMEECYTKELEDEWADENFE